MTEKKRRFVSNPDEYYEKAVQALTDLMNQHSTEWNIVERAFAQAVADSRYKNFSDSHGKEIDRNILHDKESPLRHFLGEHSSTWEKDSKFTEVSEVYELGWEGLQSLVEQCQEHHLQASISALQSWHLPGWTILIEVTEAPEDKSDASKSKAFDIHVNPLSRKKGYHQGWKDALDVVSDIMTRYKRPYRAAEEACIKYWSGPLVKWLNNEYAPPEVPPNFSPNLLVQEENEDEQ